MLLLPPLEFARSRYRRHKLHQLVVEEGDADFQRVAHAQPISHPEQVVRQVRVHVGEEHPIEWIVVVVLAPHGRRGATPPALVQLVTQVIAEHVGLFGIVKCRDIPLIPLGQTEVRSLDKALEPAGPQPAIARFRHRPNDAIDQPATQSAGHPPIIVGQ